MATLIQDTAYPQLTAGNGSGYGPDSATGQRDALLARYGSHIAVNPDLSRALVSWQSNRAEIFNHTLPMRAGRA